MSTTPSTTPPPGTTRAGRSRKAGCADETTPRPPLVDFRVDVPVSVDQSLCIEGCNLCVEVCPLDALAIDPDTGKAYMHVDECWYCGPCADRCPTGAVTVNIPYLLR